MKYIIIDDEPLARKGIKILADNLPYLQYINEFPGPVQAQECLLKHKDLALMFLDIEMPGMNGINYLKQLHPKIMVILTTAYSEYALESFELNIVDYLLKPIKLDRFIKAVNKAKEYHDLVSHQSIIQQSEDHFFIKSERSFIRLQFQDILYIKGLKDYVVIHIPDKKYMTAMNLSTVLQQLPNQEFARVSKSFIINVKHITRIDLDEIYVGDTVIPLGSSYKEDFLDRYVSGSLLKRI